MATMKRGSISLTFYEQLLHAHIPKAQKDNQVISVFFHFLGSACIRAVHKMLVKTTPEEKGERERERELEQMQKTNIFNYNFKVFKI